jgi:hypothetical protein
METAPETPKPKRPYTVTDKVREARRLSLAKAREKAKQALRGYKRGRHEDNLAYESRLARQITPWCANLHRAVAAKKADRSADYASHFTHGLTAPDLERSAAAAGENPDELRRHIERCQDAIGGLIDDCRLPIDDCPPDTPVAGSPEPKEAEGQKSNAEGSNGQSSIGNRKSPIANHQSSINRQSSIVNRQSKLVLALAYVLWRALRLMRTQVRWERRALAFRLQELAGWRDRNPALTAQRLKELREGLAGVTSDVIIASGRLQRLRKRFEALWTALVDPARWERIADHIRAPSQVPNEAMYMPASPSLLDLLPTRAARLHDGDTGDGDSPASGPERPSRTPTVRLPRDPCAGPFDPLEHLCRTRSRGEQDWRLRLDQLAAETLSVPFQSPANAERALQRPAAAVEVHDRRTGASESESVHRYRLHEPAARIPGDGLLGALAQVRVLADIPSLSVLRELLAQGLGDGDPEAPVDVSSLGASRQAVAALAEAL